MGLQPGGSCQEILTESLLASDRITILPLHASIPTANDSPLPAAPIVAASAKIQNTDDLWARAILFAPDLQNYMNTTLLGAPDFKELHELIRKPNVTLAMSFSDDPSQGANPDRFSGDSVVVSLTTVQITKTQSAMLKQ